MKFLKIDKIRCRVSCSKASYHMGGNLFNDEPTRMLPSEGVQS